MATALLWTMDGWMDGGGPCVCVCESLHWGSRRYKYVQTHVLCGRCASAEAASPASALPLEQVRSSRQDQIHNSIVSTLLALMDGLDSR